MVTTHISRRRLLTGAAGAGAALAAVAGSPDGAAAAQAQLSESFASPYAPYPTLMYPPDWFAFTGLTQVMIPAGVYVATQQLSAMPDLEGHPNPMLLPADVTLLCLFHQPLPQPKPGYELPPKLNGASMSFAALSGPRTVQAGFQKYIGGWTATADDGQLYGLQSWVYVGPNAGADWTAVQAVVDSVTMPA